MSNKLPNEIFHLIITYFTKDQFEPLLKLRTICREWKEIADHSIVWLKCRLIIHPPKLYIETFHPWQSWVYYSLHEEITCLQRRTRDIAIVREEISPIHTQATSNSINISTHSNPFNEAYEISTAFLKHYRFCHRSWRRILSIYQFFHHFEMIFRQPSGRPFFICIWFNVILLIIAAFFFSSISNNPKSLTIEENIAFICIYWNFSFYFFGFLCLLSKDILIDLRYNDSLNILKPCQILLQSRYADAHIIMVFFLAFISSFALLQSSLSSNDRSVIRYSSITVPIFLAIILGFIILIVMPPAKTKLKLGVLITFIPTFLSLFLVGLYYDQPSHNGISSLSMTFIPWLPLLLVLLAGSLYNVRKTIILWRGWIQGDTICEGQGYDCFNTRVFARLMVDFIVTGSGVMMFQVLLNLMYESFMNRLTLSMSLVSLMIFLLLIKVYIIGFKYDNFYLE